MLLVLAGCASPPPEREETGTTACQQAWAELAEDMPPSIRLQAGVSWRMVAACKRLGEQGVGCLHPPEELARLPRFGREARVLHAFSCLAEATVAAARTDGACERIASGVEDGSIATDDEDRVALRGPLADLALAGEVRALRRPDGRTWVWFPTSSFPEEGLLCSSAPFEPGDLTARETAVFVRDVPFVSRVVEELDPRWLRLSDSWDF